RGAIDPLDTYAGVQGDVVFLVPCQGIDEDVLRVMRSGEHTRQQYAVVITVRLITEYHDLELPASAPLEQVFHKARAGHSVTDDYEFLLPIHHSKSRISNLKSQISNLKSQISNLQF